MRRTDLYVIVFLQPDGTQDNLLQVLSRYAAAAIA